MTAADWLASRTPPAPAELSAHLVAGAGQADAAATPAARTEALLAAGDAEFARVLASGGATRAVAINLLSADAFVTYAFEAAADEPGTLQAHAEAAMRQISARAAPHLEAPAR
jgi:hypothetical protein